MPPALFGLMRWHLIRSGRGARGVTVAAVVWIGYGLYEWAMYVWSQRVVALIRIDLVVLAPVMYGVTAVGLLSAWQARRRRRARVA